MATKAETHHHIKNILQSLISYLSTAFTQKEQVSRNDLKKFQHFIYIQSYIQDLVYQSDEVDFSNQINAGAAIERQLALLIDSGININKSEIPDITCGIKRCSNICLILNEIFYFLACHSSSEINFQITSKEQTITFSFAADLTLDQQELIKNNISKELMLATMLIKADLKSTLLHEINDKIKIWFNFQ